MEPRTWRPDIDELAQQLVEDIRNDNEAAAFLDAIGTFASWEQLAEEHGGQLTTEDYQALAIRLAKMVADQ